MRNYRKRARKVLLSVTLRAIPNSSYCYFHHRITVYHNRRRDDSRFAKETGVDYDHGFDTEVTFIRPTCKNSSGAINQCYYSSAMQKSRCL